MVMLGLIPSIALFDAGLLRWVSWPGSVAGDHRSLPIQAAAELCATLNFALTGVEARASARPAACDRHACGWSTFLAAGDSPHVRTAVMARHGDTIAAVIGASVVVSEIRFHQLAVKICIVANSLCRMSPTCCNGCNDHPSAGLRASAHAGAVKWNWTSQQDLPEERCLRCRFRQSNGKAITFLSAPLLAAAV